MTTIEGAMTGKVADKRFHMPGVVLRSQCPKCGAAYAVDFGDGYLPYPVVGKPFASTCFCRDEECAHEWTVTLRLDVTLSVVDEVTP